MAACRINPGAVLLALALGLVATVASAARVSGLPDFTGLVKQNAPAVVNISSTQHYGGGDSESPQGDAPDLPQGHPFNDLLDRLFPDRDRHPEYDTESLGSGFIISHDGVILTNKHVVEDATEIIVRLSDRREFEAKLVGADDASDVAVLKIDAHDLPTVHLGKSSTLQVGEWVLAIGSPFGFEHSATAGIVSAKGRNLPSENYVPFIQTDVAINPGNSGGPLFDLDGNVVGINSQIYSRTGGFQGISFAIPIELAVDVADQIRTSGHVSRGWLGVVIQDVTRDLADSFGMRRPYGALVSEILPDSPAADAGLEVGDVIVAYQGREVTTSGKLPPMVGRTAAGRDVTVEVIRNGAHRKLDVTIGKLPDHPMLSRTAPKKPTRPRENAVERLGMTVGEIPDALRERLDLARDVDGVVITGLQAGAAADAGLEQGDVITQFDRRPVAGAEALRKQVEALSAGATVSLIVQREDGPRFFALHVPE